MVQKRVLFSCLVFLGFAATGFASSSNMNMLRGGLGFLFPDHNSFINPGQFGASHGAGLQAYYGGDVAAGPQTMTPSFVWGNGMIGLGAYGSRYGTLASGTDSIGGGLGVSLLKGRLTVGARYDKVVGSTEVGDVTGSLTMNPMGGHGMSVGVAYKRTLTAGTSALTAGLGYSFMSNNNLEVNVSWADITNTQNFDLGAYFTTMKSIVYLGAGYIMSKSTVMAHGVTGRLGFMLGQNVDFSGIATYYFVTGSALNYGATLRFSF